MKEKSIYKQPPEQPKKYLGEYVRENSNILVPAYLGHVDDAIKRGKPFIIKSETPYEFAGASGILDSYIITMEKLQKILNLAESPIQTNESLSAIIASFMRNRKRGIYLGTAEFHFYNRLSSLPKTTRKIISYCQYAGLDIRRFKKSISYSCWEYIEGINGSIIADSVIPGRYHIKINDGYLIIEDKNCIKEFTYENQQTLDYLKSQIARLIDFYETVRNLPLFRKQECPVIEFQLDKNNQIYFLQYHRTRRFKKAPAFQIPDIPGKTIRALIVRGSTGRRGKVYEINLASLVTGKGFGEIYIKGMVNYSFPYIEATCRSREIVLLNQDDITFYPDHACQSLMFKPEIFLVLKYTEILTPTRFKKMREKRNPFIMIKVVSNGRDAWVQVVSDVYSKEIRPISVKEKLRKRIKNYFLKTFSKKAKKYYELLSEYKNFYREVQKGLAVAEKNQVIPTMKILVMRGSLVNWYKQEELYYAVVSRLVAYLLPIKPAAAADYLRDFLFSSLARYYAEECRILYKNIIDSFRIESLEKIKKLPYSIKLLYVDDKKWDFRSFEKFMEDMNFELYFTNEPDDALKRISADRESGKPFHVVVAGYQFLGKGNGINLLREALHLDENLVCILYADWFAPELRQKAGRLYRRIHILAEKEMEHIPVIIARNLERIDKIRRE